MKRKQPEHAPSAGERPGRRRRRIAFHDYSAENDIRYRGPLSYRALMIMGWLAIAVSPLSMFLGIASNISLDAAQALSVWSIVVRLISGLSLPCLLIANFSRILSNDGEYKRQLTQSGIAFLGVAALFWLFVYRYLTGTAAAFSRNPDEAGTVLRGIYGALDANGFLSFNIFVDLFMCGLFTFFVNYRPARFFKGRKRILFRLLALLPIAYELASLALKAQAASGKIVLPFWVFPLLSVKPPMTFLLFVVLVLFVKRREIRFCKKGGRTHEEYQAFLRTNRNSLHFSIFLAVCLLVTGIADFFLWILFVAMETVDVMGPEAEIAQETVNHFLEVGTKIGFGQSAALIPLAPFLLLFSYNRKPARRQLDALIPVAGIALALFFFVEGGYQALGWLELPKLDLDALTEALSGIRIFLAGGFSP